MLNNVKLFSVQLLPDLYEKLEKNVFLHFCLHFYQDGQFSSIYKSARKTIFVNYNYPWMFFTEHEKTIKDAMLQILRC